VTTLTITAKGQVTLKREVMDHLGITPGDRVEVELLPGGKATLHAAPAKVGWDKLSGFFKGKTTKVATLEEIDAAIQDGWSGKLDRYR